MLVQMSSSALKDGRWYEYVVRFVLGGVATVFTGVVAKLAGPSMGGLFLALPAIFCASATLVERHEIRRKRENGLDGERRGKQAAGLDAYGAALGGLGMLVFAIIFTSTVERSVALAFACASGGWLVASVIVWLADRKIRSALR
jgi:hypothetical protein